MSKEHQFIIKTIVRGDRTPMYLETYTLGDRSSQVYKDAMKLLNSGYAQQEASLELALEVSKEQDLYNKVAQVNNRPMVGVMHVNDGVDTDTMQPTGMRNRLLMPKKDYGNPAGQVDLTLEGLKSYVSPGTKLAAELEHRYPNKNWKGRVNKAFDAFNESDSTYSPQDIAVCLLSLCSEHDQTSKYRALLELDFDVTVNVVRDILQVELDRATKVEHAMKVPSTLRMQLSPSEKNPEGVIAATQEAFHSRYDKVAGVLFENEKLDYTFDVTVIPLENNLRAWVKSDILSGLVCQAVDNDWTTVKLRRKVENLFNTAGTPNWFTVVEGWFNTAMDVERASRGEQQASPAEPLASPLIKQLRDGSANILSDQTLVDSLHLMFAKGMVEDEQIVHALFEVLGHPGNYADFIAAERSCVIPQELRALCLERFGMTEEPVREGYKPHFIVGNSETQEITSVTQTTYYRNEQFKDAIAFGSAPGSRSQDEIIGVLAYEMEANENDPDCVSVMHYQFFYQGDGVFVTDRYGNTVDRLR